jgi:hypothetical protein
MLPSLQDLLVASLAPQQLTLQAYELTMDEMQFLGHCLVTAAVKSMADHRRLLCHSSW